MPAACTCTGSQPAPHRGSSSSGQDLLSPMRCQPGRPCLLPMPLGSDGKQHLSPRPWHGSG